MPDFGRWNANGGDPSLNEINRSDQFLDALASQQPVYATDRGEAELANLLAGWRDDVRETPISEIVTPEEAALALDRVTSPGRRRRLSLAVVGSAAAAVLCLGGFGAVIAGAGPGDALYGLRTMLFGEQQTETRDDAVILAAQTEMQQVQQLIDQGDWEGAQAKLEAVTTTVATVNDVESKQDLVTQWQELTVKVEAQDAAATVAPGASLPTFPDVPVVLDPGTLPVLTPGTSETTTSDPATSPMDTSSSETTSPSSETPPTTSAPATTTTTSAPATTTTTSAPATTTTSTVATTTSATPQPTPSATPKPTPSASPQPTPSAPKPTPSAAPIPTPAAPIPTPTAAPIPTPTAAVQPTPEAPQPTPAAPLPTTTTPLVEPEATGESAGG